MVRDLSSTLDLPAASGDRAPPTAPRLTYTPATSTSICRAWAYFAVPCGDVLPDGILGCRSAVAG